jgi:hypothetical protein
VRIVSASDATSTPIVPLMLAAAEDFFDLKGCLINPFEYFNVIPDKNRHVHDAMQAT